MSDLDFTYKAKILSVELKGSAADAWEAKKDPEGDGTAVVQVAFPNGATDKFNVSERNASELIVGRDVQVILRLPDLSARAEENA